VFLPSLIKENKQLWPSRSLCHILCYDINMLRRMSWGFHRSLKEQVDPCARARSHTSFLCHVDPLANLHCLRCHRVAAMAMVDVTPFLSVLWSFNRVGFRPGKSGVALIHTRSGVICVCLKLRQWDTSSKIKYRMRNAVPGEATMPLYLCCI